MLRVSNTAVAFLALAASLWAQDSAPSDQKTIALLVQQVKALQQETSDLREKVRKLEGDRAPAAPAGVRTEAAAPQSAQVTPPEITTPHPTAEATPPESSPELTAAMHDLHGIQWRGFGELDYQALDQRQPELGTYGFVPGSAANFYTGDFDLFLHSRLTEKTSVLADISFEEGDAQSYKLDLRQALLKYEMNEYLKISLGRYQTDIGYYNSAYRSAAWLQTTADRPLIMEYASNGGLLPTQAVGISITGAIPSGKLGLNYIAEYGTSDTIRPDLNGAGTVNDENDGNHVLVGWFAHPDWAPGLQIGGSFFHDKISDAETSLADRFGQTILNSYVVYIAHGIESLNEVFLIRETQLATGIVSNTPAFYSQISRRWGRVRPFVRYQYVNASGRNTIFNDVGLRAGPSFGARYDFNDYVAFKAQLDHTQRESLPDLNGLHLQVAFTF
jgi:hypothetical protein